MTKRIILAVAGLVLTALLCAGGYVLMRGMPVSGAPNVNDVQSITVKYGEELGGGVEYTDQEKLESACGLVGSLSYDPFAQGDEENEIAVTIVFNMKDGSKKVAAANAQTGWWAGKALALKREGEFVKLAQGLFPQE